MSPMMQMAAPPPLAAYTPTSDVMDRHEYGVTKNRKAASTGGGRAWSEDEEVYLLQTRLQKMPYKHIAAHLKKTELACRLHYHQLSHGSNRRKRTTSVSSGSSTGGHSPILPASIPSPIRESSSRSTSPPGSAGSYGPGSPGGVHLPSIGANGIVGGNNSNSPRLPAILPKPASMTLALSSSPSAPGSAASTMSRGYPTPLADVATPHSAPLMPAASFTRTPTSTTATPHSAHHPHHHPSLRLDCSSAALPQLHHHLQQQPSSAPLAHLPVDLGRLGAIYAAHRAGFWAAVAAEYGAGANAVVLEQAWKNGACCGSHSGASGPASSTASAGVPVSSSHYHTPQHHHHQQQQHQQHHGQTATPITPVHSPEDRDAYPVVTAVPNSTSNKSDKTRISAILGIDADPRSPKERELVRRLEERVGA